MTRRSWNVRPGEILRTFCSDSQFEASRASTIRLRTPSCSMNAITSCCAPAPIDSMATTAATPKIMPSIVSSERSLCARRLSSPSRSSGRKSVGRAGDASAGDAHLDAPRAEHRAWLPRRTSLARARRWDRSSATSVPSGRPSSAARLSVRCDDLHLALLEPVAGLDEDVRLAVLLEHRLTRHGQRVGDLPCRRSSRAPRSPPSSADRAARTGTRRRTGASRSAPSSSPHACACAGQRADLAP